ncbi:pyroglutamyl-peptidase I [Curtobacterium sp. MCBD17_034]|uniref:pyroglutamyl-peptidase I n=1 Tax=unclassified Curtobacterium TaxID=257496 RepID=UPI000DA82E9D|nr:MULTISPECIES: pyroglutamyl-peptidase I [unclassified Curtobacterium]PZF61067.1 pyroglutamyl-peptidase I [Curtobacterium sp. MCBD17_034]PZM40417.1 pyroglutamyl-peptidase I [Curtobacterium sp. MCBD17_031]WIE55777.1 pyroglutamyl-peptidase I [Curtobacterium sp. MCBD17_003]
MTTILLTGFEPFADAPRNPSWDAVERVAATWTGPERVEAVLLPVAFGRSVDALRDAVERVTPDVVVAVGLAEGRSAITPERVAVNLDDARIPDADGAQPVDVPVLPGGPAAYFTTLPVKRMVAAARAAGAPAALSATAGAYVCNHVFYALQALAGAGVRSGFVHVPATPETLREADDAVPTVSLDVLVTGLAAAVRAAVDPAPDLAVAGGAIS